MTEAVVADQAAAEEADVEAVAVDVGVAADKRLIIMKKIVIHSASVMISLVWLWVTCHTLNPVTLKGPDFLTFYIILVLGFYASVFIINSLREKISKETFYFAGFIFLLGMIKLVWGIILGKPIGFLVMILIAECIVAVALMPAQVNKNMK
ncbi:hypothetical protein [Chryseobacterium sp.]|uniref:hypothetical protein n=1 Tax=Chryseobacterium sp. TaxID=1871047 RepID=UPI0031DBCB93